MNVFIEVVEHKFQCIFTSAAHFLVAKLASHFLLKFDLIFNLQVFHRCY